MPSELSLPALAAAFLLWCLVCTLHQSDDDGADVPMWVWREALLNGWSDWTELRTLSANTSYDVVLATVRDVAHADATAVQFASVMHPAGAPDYTLRVLFVSAVRETALELVTSAQHDSRMLNS